MVIDPMQRTKLEQVVAEGLTGLRERPAPLQAERLACLLGVPPTLAMATAAETASIVEVLERVASPEAAQVLLALDRLIASPWARAALPAAQRLAEAGVAAAGPPAELEVRDAFLSDLGELALLGVHVQAGTAHFLATLIAQRTGQASAHLDGGLASPLQAEQVEQRATALRESLGSAVELPDPADARKQAALLFAWARDSSAPSTEGLELERPLLALALTGRRDPWPRLPAVPEYASRRMREQLGAEAAPEPAPARVHDHRDHDHHHHGHHHGLILPSREIVRPSDPQRKAAKAARGARKRNRGR